MTRMGALIVPIIFTDRPVFPIVVSIRVAHPPAVRQKWGMSQAVQATSHATCYARPVTQGPVASKTTTLDRGGPADILTSAAHHPCNGYHRDTDPTVVPMLITAFSGIGRKCGDLQHR